MIRAEPPQFGTLLPIRHRSAGYTTRQERHTHNVGSVSPGIRELKIGTRIHVESFKRLGDEAALLEELPTGSVFEGLSELQGPTDQSPQVVVDTPLKQPATHLIDNDDTGRGEQQWSLANEFAQLADVRHEFPLPPSDEPVRPAGGVVRVILFRPAQN
ncbi:hypothetical protein CLV67_11380 [Actinoplanes italicus]|uniref:Uncharacterized protein n=1 Tax=Actinoplanes italicus TaxID=113567 RepID=A0A2T0K5J7_9ACTN|nr:hypothetical protein CLV67_11380 [Actinoplanes italicus]